MRPVTFRGRLSRTQLLPFAAFSALSAGLVAQFLFSAPAVGRQIHFIGLLATAVPVAVKTLRGVLRGKLAADLVALIAIVAAVALGAHLVGLVIVLMQTGGEALEQYAEGRASRALRDLEEQAPRTAHRMVGTTISDVRVEDLLPGEEILLRPGELVPCDSVVIEGRSHVDASSITGEPLPIAAIKDVKLLSGSANGEGALKLRVTALARESQYARIVELVRTAQASKSPLQKTADRYAVWFTPFTLTVCLVTWILSQDMTRVLAVLAVATPCPLIIATPVALLGGINRCARRQIIVRHGTALEQIGRTTAVVFDKTGTLTVGMPMVNRVATSDGWTEGELLRFAATIEEKSSHLLARVLVAYAKSNGIRPLDSWDVVETAGRGVQGRVADAHVLAGSRSFAIEHHPGIADSLALLLGGLSQEESRLFACVVVDGELAGVVIFGDKTRPQIGKLLGDLSALGVRHVALLSGDHSATVRTLAAELGIKDVEGDLLPADKVSRVRDLRDQGHKVVMVGDGTNDAPALTAATVGIAIGGGVYGSGITAEAADMVLLTDDVSRVAEAITISRRTMLIAHQSIWFGLGASAVGMFAASAGMLAPIGGALLQESIDLAVILNALRASLPVQQVQPRLGK